MAQTPRGSANIKLPKLYEWYGRITAVIAEMGHAQPATRMLEGLHKEMLDTIQARAQEGGS